MKVAIIIVTKRKLQI